MGAKKDFQDYPVYEEEVRFNKNVFNIGLSVSANRAAFKKKHRPKCWYGLLEGCVEGLELCDVLLFWHFGGPPPSSQINAHGVLLLLINAWP